MTEQLEEPENDQPVDLERSLAELEALVERMEKGDLSLEESLRLFEHGIGLARKCQTTIANAEQRVEQLLTEHGENRIVPLEDDQDEASSS